MPRLLLAFSVVAPNPRALQGQKYSPAGSLPVFSLTPSNAACTRDARASPGHRPVAGSARWEDLAVQEWRLCERGQAAAAWLCEKPNRATGDRLREECD